MASNTDNLLVVATHETHIAIPPTLPGLHHNLTPTCHKVFSPCLPHFANDALCSAPWQFKAETETAAWSKTFNDKCDTSAIHFRQAQLLAVNGLYTRGRSIWQCRHALECPSDQSECPSLLRLTAVPNTPHTRFWLHKTSQSRRFLRQETYWYATALP